MSGHSDTRTPQILPDPPQQTVTEKIAQSLIPYQRDDARARYLSLRCSGFTIREALRLIKNAHSTLSLWRQSPEFVACEEKIPEIRKELSMEYANLEWMRNFRLVLEKDYQVLQKSLYPEKDAAGRVIPISGEDHSYLLKMRTQYTPQQLQIMEALVSQEKNVGMDFTDFVLTAHKMEQRITIEAHKVLAGDNGSHS